MSPERGIAYGGRPLWQPSPRSSPRTGKPSTWRRGAGGFDGIQQGGTQDEKRRNCTERHTHWRAGCAERRTSGSEGGRRKSASGNRSNSPAAYPTQHTGWRWFITEWDPETGLCFGLVEGFEAEIGYFDLTELAEATVFGSVPAVERDLYWKPMTIGEIRRGG